MDLGTFHISKQILIGLAAPPAIAGLFWLIACGWVVTVGPGDITARTKQRLKMEFRIVLFLLYIFVFGENLYSLLS